MQFPILQWVDDHLFIRVPHSHMQQYNELQRSSAARIVSQEGPAVHGGCFWFKGGLLPNRSIEQFDKDCTFLLHNFAAIRNEHKDNQPYPYSIVDINNIFSGIPWEPSKDVPFLSTPTFIGFTWDLEQCTVSLAEAKQHKYLAALQEWC